MVRPAVFIAAVAALAWAPSQGALVGTAPLTPGGTDYQAVYDTDFNITWLANANFALTNSFGVLGILGGFGVTNWPTAESYVAAMNSANYLGVNEWRLPTTNQPDLTCGTQTPVSGFPTQGSGLGCAGSEMGHLYYVDVVRPDPVGLPSPFRNVQELIPYWSGTQYAPNPSNSWAFNFTNGAQYNGIEPGGSYVWPVTPGNPFNAIPVPPVALLFPSALAALAWPRQRNRIRKLE